MSLSASIPGLIVAGGSYATSASEADPGQLQTMYENLLSGAADIVSGSGTKVVVLTAGAIGTAGPAQIGNTETASEVAGNAAVLANIAAFCQANDVAVEVDAVLTDPATFGTGQNLSNALVDQWAPAAAAAGLPITAVEDVQEIGTSQPQADFNSDAAIEANAVSTLIADYSTSSYHMAANNLAVGDMEGGGASSMAAILDWWKAYNAAATAAGVSTFSFATADTGWFAPWIGSESVPTWQAYLEALSSLAASNSMDLNVVVQGPNTDATASQFVLQAEQNAANLAELAATGSVLVSNIAVESWQVLPVGVGMISSPTSSSNEAAEIAATYPLYASGSITAGGPLVASLPGQIVQYSGAAEIIAPLSLQWDTADVLANNRLCVVIIDQTGSLTARQYGSGTVADPADNILVLNGNSADLAAELRSVMLTEPDAGPDTIDVATYGVAGRLSDGQISVLAAAPGASVDAIEATSDSQGWLSASALLNDGTVIDGGSALTGETFDWRTTGAQAGSIADGNAQDQSGFVKIDTVHEPLAEYGVENAPAAMLGTAAGAVADIYDPSVDDGVFTSDGYANNFGASVPFSPLAGWVVGAFDPANSMTSFIVKSTQNAFDPQTGQLEASVDSLAADPLTVVDLTGTHADAFATAFDTGGTQVTEFDTPGNTAWQAGWGSQFSSATLTYDGAGQLVEKLLQGGPSDPTFTIDDVYDPNGGELWEEFQSAPPPPIGAGTLDYAASNNPYQPGFATGPLYVTEFDTGNNPNWDYKDWGAAIRSDTEVWTDYLILANAAGFAETAAVPSTYPREFVNGTALDLMDLPGTIAVDLNQLGTVTIASQTMPTGLSGLTEIDAAGDSGTVTITGVTAGNCALIGGDNISTINGYGHDAIVAGAGQTTINTGSGGSTVLLADAAAAVAVAGNNDTITGVAGGTLTLDGTGDTVNGSGATVSMTSGNASLILAGNTDTVSVTAGSTVTQAGTADVLNYLGGGVLVQGDGSSSVTANGNGTVVWMSQNGGTVTAAGDNDTITAGVGAAISLTGSDGVVGSGSGSSLGIAGRNDTVCGSDMAVSAATSSTSLTVAGDNDAITAVAGSTLTLDGTGDTVNGSGATASMTSSNAGLIVAGNADAVSVTAGSTVIQAGTADVVNYLGGGVLVQGDGSSSVAANGNGAVVWMSQNGGTVTAAGDNDTITGGTGAAISLTGSNGVVGAGSGSSVSIGGQHDTVYASGITVLATTSSTSLTVVGNGDRVTRIAGTEITLCGTGDKVRGSGATVSMTTSNASLIVAGHLDTVSVTAGSTVTQAGTADVLNYLGGGVLVQRNASSSVAANGNGVVVWMSQNGGTVSAAGNNDTITGGTGAVVSLTGNNGAVGAGAGSSVSIGGQNDTVCGSDMAVSATTSSTSLTLAGNDDTITAVAGSTLTLDGTGDTVNGSGLGGGTYNVTSGVPNYLGGGDAPVSSDMVTTQSISENSGAVGATPGSSAGNSASVTVAITTQALLSTSPGNMLFMPADGLTVAANAGIETFAFPASGFGQDTITGFNLVQDIIQLPQTIAASFANLQSHESAVDGGTLISFGPSESITLAGVTPGSLQSSNFQFV